MARSDLTLEQVLDAAEFSDTKGLILAQREGQDLDVRLRYGDFLDSKEGMDAVYELAEVPQVYFKFLAEATDKKLRHAHGLAWNRGDAPLLMVVCPSEVRIFNCYSRPREEEAAFDKHCLLDTLTSAEEGIERLRSLYGRTCLDTGTFWRTREAQRIGTPERVDQQLLKDIGHTTAILISQGLTAPVAQALVGRAIFLSYLVDSGVLGASSLEQDFGSSKLAGIFAEPDRSWHLLRWAEDTFNGDVFPLDPPEVASVGAEHFETVQQFLSGADMSSDTRQGRLWPYNFNTIPIALISSIYEMFAHAEDQGAALRTGVHYTPHLLVGLMLARAMDGLNSHARILDPACGSGIFLVEAFKRLVYKREQETGEYPARDELKSILTTQIYGLELSEEAARVAAFSLYLALLELDRDRASVSALRLPHLLDTNVFAPVDAFDEKAAFNRRDVFRERKFDLVVGNPPWTPWRAKKKSPGEEYCEARDLPLGNRTPYQAFLWRAAELARRSGRVAMLVHAGLLFRKLARDARTKLLTDFSVSEVVNLMDLRRLPVFVKAQAPPAIVFYSHGPPAPDARLRYHCPKWSVGTKRTGQVVVLDDDIVDLAVSAVLETPELWKTAFWGTAADHALLRRLRAHGTLGVIRKGGGWTRRRGPSPTSNPKQPPIPEALVGKPTLHAEDAGRYGIDVDSLPRLGMGHWRRNTNPGAFAGPQVIVAYAPSDARMCAIFTPEPVVFDQRFWGYCVPPEHADIARYLSAILNSDLATYMVFLTASGWGVERDDIIIEDVEALPVPAWDELRPTVRKSILELEASLREAAIAGAEEQVQGHRQLLEEALWDLYGITEEEADLVRDTLLSAVDFFCNRDDSEAVAPPTEGNLREYAEALLSAINPYVQAIDQAMSAIVWHAAGGALQIVEITQRAPCGPGSVEVRSCSNAREVLKRLSDALLAEVTNDLAVRRSLRIYDGETVLIVKHSQRRYWTPSAGRADADAIVSDHLEMPA